MPPLFRAPQQEYTRPAFLFEDVSVVRYELSIVIIHITRWRKIANKRIIKIQMTRFSF